MSLFEYFAANSTRLTWLFVQHIEVVAIAVVAASVLGVGGGLATTRMPRVRRALLSTSATFLTIPSFALFGLLVPLFGLGLVPTVIALTFYGIFPILRNTVTGLATVDPAVSDAARGMGMSARQRLARVNLPLAWPVIMGGVRVAAIMLVAIAAIGAAVRGPGLGALIFRGLARIGGANALNEALAGVIGVVLVALIFDLIFLALIRLTTPRGLHVAH